MPGSDIDAFFKDLNLLYSHPNEILTVGNHFPANDECPDLSGTDSALSVPIFEYQSKILKGYIQVTASALLRESDSERQKCLAKDSSAIAIKTMAKHAKSIINKTNNFSEEDMRKCLLRTGKDTHQHMYGFSRFDKNRHAQCTLAASIILWDEKNVVCTSGVVGNFSTLLVNTKNTEVETAINSEYFWVDSTNSFISESIQSVAFQYPDRLQTHQKQLQYSCESGNPWMFLQLSRGVSDYLNAREIEIIDENQTKKLVGVIDGAKISAELFETQKKCSQDSKNAHRESFAGHASRLAVNQTLHRMVAKKLAAPPQIYDNQKFYERDSKKELYLGDATCSGIGFHSLATEYLRAWINDSINRHLYIDYLCSLSKQQLKETCHYLNEKEKHIPGSNNNPDFFAEEIPVCDPTEVERAKKIINTITELELKKQIKNLFQALKDIPDKENREIFSSRLEKLLQNTDKNHIVKDFLSFAMTLEGRPNPSRRETGYVISTVSTVYGGGGVAILALHLGILCPPTLAILAVTVFILGCGIACYYFARHRGLSKAATKLANSLPCRLFRKKESNVSSPVPSFPRNTISKSS